MHAAIDVISVRISLELLEDEYVQVSALLNPARGCRICKRTASGSQVLNYFMLPVDTGLPHLQVIYNKYKNTVPNVQKEENNGGNQVNEDFQNEVVVPQSSFSLLLQTNATNAGVAMFSLNVRRTFILFR